MNLMDLPDTVLMGILEMLTYDEVAQKREICSRFNYLCQYVLNMGFKKVVKDHSKYFKSIKALLPRRESERGDHVLARHFDIMTCVQTRISILKLTYSRYIDLNVCCFIPGRVLDEIISILKLLTTTTKPLRPLEVLKELRDISSMAIEHFDEKIAIDFKKALTLNDYSRSAVCGSMGDIGFNHMLKTPVVHLNMITLNPNGDAIFHQQYSYANDLATSGSGVQSGINFNSCNCGREFSKQLQKQAQKQAQKQQLLYTRIRFLEGSRRRHRRRLQKALGSITELTGQVTELKRMLEDMQPRRTTLETFSNGDFPPASKKPKYN